jgi:glycosyltransferase involved in cell wall biosynthesis
VAPIISVITTVYNGEPYLREAIESVLAQSVSDFEYVIVNDASTDNSLKILHEYAAKDARIRVIDNEKNLGLPGSRNKVLPMVRGKYVAWQDADDVSLPHRFERILARMEDDPTVGMCGAWLEFFQGDTIKGYRRYDVDDAPLRKRIFRYSPVAHPTALIRRECFEQLGGFDLSFAPAEDLELSFRFGTRFKFANVPEVLLRYRQHTASMTFTKLSANERGVLRIRSKYRKNAAYHRTAFDVLYNELQRASISLVPPRLKIALFDLMRNSRA